VAVIASTAAKSLKKSLAKLETRPKQKNLTQRRKGAKVKTEETKYPRLFLIRLNLCAFAALREIFLFFCACFADLSAIQASLVRLSLRIGHKYGFRAKAPVLPPAPENVASRRC
jgi:hypothetical protein